MLRTSSVPSWVIRILRQIHGISFTQIEPGAFYLSVAEGKRFKFSVQLLNVLSREKAGDLVEEWNRRAHGERPLFAVRHISAHTREVLRAGGLSWVEGQTGICHIVAPGILIDTRVEDAEQEESTSVPSRLRDRSGLIAEALLSMDQNCAIRVSAITKQTQVSAGLVSRVFRRLTNLGILDEHGAGPNRYWHLKDFGALLELWGQEERQVERVTNLYVWSRSPQALYERLPKLHDLKAQWAIAGVAAANLYAPTLSTAPNPIIRLDAAVPAKEVASLLAGEVVDKGANLEVWQTAGNLALQKAKPWMSTAGAIGDPAGGLLQIISRPRAYIESIAGPGRAPEVAQNLRERMISTHG
jgi:hypothetical protein